MVIYHKTFKNEITLRQECNIHGKKKGICSSDLPNKLDSL